MDKNDEQRRCDSPLLQFMFLWFEKCSDRLQISSQELKAKIIAGDVRTVGIHAMMHFWRWLCTSNFLMKRKALLQHSLSVGAQCKIFVEDIKKDIDLLEKMMGDMPQEILSEQKWSSVKEFMSSIQEYFSLNKETDVLKIVSEKVDETTIPALWILCLSYLRSRSRDGIGIYYGCRSNFPYDYLFCTVAELGFLKYLLEARKENRHAILYAGAIHTQAVADFLKKLGYMKVVEYGDSIERSIVQSLSKNEMESLVTKFIKLSELANTEWFKQINLPRHRAIPAHHGLAIGAAGYSVNMNNCVIK